MIFIEAAYVISGRSVCRRVASPSSNRQSASQNTSIRPFQSHPLAPPTLLPTPIHPQQEVLNLRDLDEIDYQSVVDLVNEEKERLRKEL